MAKTAPDASAAPLMLSVSGARGLVGQTMTPAVAANFAAAFGSFIKASTGIRQPTMCLGRDSRPTGEMLAAAATAGLASVGCAVIDLGVVTTPSVAVMIGKHRAAGGMAITASHNPIIWNGLKCLNSDGVAPPPQHTNEIIQRFKTGDIQYADVTAIPPITRDDSSNRTHVDKVLTTIDPAPIRRAKLRVVLDSVNGAGCIAGRMLLEELGCEVIHLNGEPTGHFAHTPEPTEANLEDLKKRTAAAGAACGFAQDPDADRLAIVDENGRYIGEEYTLVLAAKRVLELRHRGGDSPLAPGSAPPGGPDNTLFLATNLSTSRMIDDLAATYPPPGVTVLRTAVGEANVVAALKEHGAAAVLGGEGNGGVIFPPVCWVRDSLSSMALVLGLIAADPQRRPLSAIVDSLPRYRMIKHKFDLKDVGGAEGTVAGGAGGGGVKPALERVIARFAGEKISTLDGVRIDFPPESPDAPDSPVDASGSSGSSEGSGGWVHLRPSNTEPIIRLIAEAKTDSRAWELIDAVASAAGLPPAWRSQAGL